jgi:hypothetical protein
VSPVRYELGFYIPEDGILHSHRRENFKSYTAKTVNRISGCLQGIGMFCLSDNMLIRSLSVLTLQSWT